MSTDYSPLKQIRFADLFDGRLDRFGVREQLAEDETTDTRRCLTDGNNYLWAFANEDGFASSFTRYMPGGAPGRILRAVGARLARRSRAESRFQCSHLTGSGP